MKKSYIFEMPMKVRDYEVDSEGIVNNAVYLHYLEHTRHEFCEWAGMTFRSMHERGIDPVLSKVEIEYKTPLGLGESFRSCLNISREGARFIFHQDIYNSEGKIVVKAKVACVTTVNGRLTRGDELVEAFAKYLSD
ncbi:acyl-CoA thioesterase [Barnesiella sp. WM24]|uniref:acyl-CoA thioesterase n=1 Tax=Barnesiella sp. WM24 TaxID=2558278 RepID=UPI0010725E65|nr:acyl-CoA thioesterase [Barnesiella sp. WM24]MDE6114676.1 acyl-CoA thioesterase [Muribaculum sp.]TFU94091.1 acyl-CoA thioesterase [Barnesiella sp. WM24]